MSSLESKLSASMQSSRRRGGTPTGGSENEDSAEHGKPSHKGSAESQGSADLNAGGGRERNPGRIWPD